MESINEKITIGPVDMPIFSFDQRSIEDIVCNNSVDLIGDELSSDVLEVSVFYDGDELSSIAYATPIYYYNGDVLVGKYYVNSVERKGVKRWLIRSTSLIGLIEKENFYGGFYEAGRFEDILYDILFTNGILTNKYYVYYPKTKALSTSEGTRMLNSPASAIQWKYRLHIEFITLGINRTASSAQVMGLLAGQNSSNYKVEAYARKFTDQNTYWDIYVYYGGYSYKLSTSPLIGDGSRIVIDVNPIGGKLTMQADYIKYDDGTNGTITKTYDISAVSSTSKIYLGTVFGASGSSGTGTVSYAVGIAWKEHKVYDENNNLIIDGLYAYNEDNGKYYVVNTVDGSMMESSYFETYGDTVGLVSDFSRLERSLELYNNIVFGDGIADVIARGWIKNTTRRDALHQLLFSTNVCLLKTDDGKYLFTRISDYISGSILDENIYDDSGETVVNAAKKISVNEYTFETDGVTSQIVFDNSSNIGIAGQYIAIFDKSPVYGEVVGNGITIIAHNCNAAIVTGRGTIKGTVYNSYSTSIEYHNADMLDGSDVSVNNIGLITSINSDVVLNKLKAYYSGKLKKIKNSIIYNNEKCGLKYTFNTLYGIKSGFLTSFKSIVSSVIKSQCTFITGFVPESGSGYSSFSVKTYNEEFIIPQSVREKEYPTIRLNIIGCGNDGSNGENGSNGSYARTGTGALPAGEGGEGGAAGTGGDGGKIYSLSLDVADINKFTVSKSGKETVVSAYDDNGNLVESYTSNTGNKRDSGFTNIFTGIIYARKGVDGIAGGKGGKGGYLETGEYDKPIMPEIGSDVLTYAGGISFKNKMYSYIGQYGTDYVFQSYGGGGGAAYGKNGKNASGTNGSTVIRTYGGDGANALITTDVYGEYGSGGFGGNGGGGGGGAGTSTISANSGSQRRNYTTSSYEPGKGGLGSSGTHGIDGCVIIYY